MIILIKNASIITQNKKREQISKGFVIINDDKFEKIIRGNPVNRDIKKADKIIDAKGMIILPGFINAHVHLGESIFKDFFKGKYSLEHYLSVTNELTKKTDLIEGGRKIIADYSILKLIKNGTTTICGGRTTDSSECWGMRNVSGYMLMNSFKLKNFSIDIENKFKEEYAKIGKTNLSYLALFIHSLNTVEHTLIKNIKKILKKYSRTNLILHIAETEKQEQEIENKFGKSSVEFLYRSGLLTDRTILIHGNCISNCDIDLIKKHKASLVHCLSSNLKVAGRTLDIKNILSRKIKMCIATDGLVTSGISSVLQEAQRCFIYHNRNQREGDNIISLQKTLDLITIDAAEVLGLKSHIGSIEKGKKADVIFIKKENISKNMIDDIIRGKNKIYGMILDGKFKIWNNKVLMINERKIVDKFRTLTKRIKEEVK